MESNSPGRIVLILVIIISFGYDGSAQSAGYRHLLCGCLNGGTCSSPEVCTCAPGWTGNNCEQAICSGGCHNGGTCSSPEVCTCAPGWTAINCEQDINECSTSNGGCDHHCLNTNGSYLCSCVDGYVLSMNSHNCSMIGKDGSDTTDFPDVCWYDDISWQLVVILAIIALVVIVISCIVCVLCIVVLCRQRKKVYPITRVQPVVSRPQEANQDREKLLEQTIENAQQSTKEMQQVTKEACKTMKAVQQAIKLELYFTKSTLANHVSKGSRCSSAGSTHADSNQEKTDSTESSNTGSSSTITITSMHSNHASSTE